MKTDYHNNQRSMGNASMTIGRLLLRPSSADDAEFYEALENDIKVKRFIGGPSGRDANYYRPRLFLNQRNKHPSNFTVLNRSSNTIIGRAGVIELANQKIEIYCVLAEEFWGQGYGFEIVSSLVKICQEFFPGKSIVGKVHPDNNPSIRIIKKIGFREIATINSDNFDDGFKKYVLMKDDPSEPIGENEISQRS